MPREIALTRPTKTCVWCKTEL